MHRFTITTQRTYDIAPDRLWPVVADLDGYADHVAGLSSTTVLNGDGLGAVRRCTTTGDDSWTEAVTRWEQGRTYTVAVDTSTYPFPLRQLFRTFTGTWTVEPEGVGSTVTVHFEADVRGGRVLVPLVRLMASKSRRELEDTLTSYGRAAAVI